MLQSKVYKGVKIIKSKVLFFLSEFSILIGEKKKNFPKNLGKNPISDSMNRKSKGIYRLFGGRIRRTEGGKRKS